MKVFVCKRNLTLLGSLRSRLGKIMITSSPVKEFCYVPIVDIAFFLWDFLEGKCTQQLTIMAANGNYC